MFTQSLTGPTVANILTEGDLNSLALSTCSWGSCTDCSGSGRRRGGGGERSRDGRDGRSKTARGLSKIVRGAIEECWPLEVVEIIVFGLAATSDRFTQSSARFDSINLPIENRAARQVKTAEELQ